MKQKCGTDVGVHHVVVLLGARVDKVLIVADTRVVDQDVDLPEGLHCGFNRLFRRAFLPGIAEDTDSLRAQLFCLLLELVEPFLTPRREHQSRALSSQGTRTSLSDTGAGAGDQSHFTIEFCCHIFDFIILPSVGRSSRAP